jgi:hypothetical protein
VGEGSGSLGFLMAWFFFVLICLFFTTRIFKLSQSYRLKLWHAGGIGSTVGSIYGLIFGFIMGLIFEVLGSYMSILKVILDGNERVLLLISAICCAGFVGAHQMAKELGIDAKKYRDDGS